MLVPAGETEMATLGRSSDHQTVDNPMPGKGSNVSGDFVIDKAVGGEGEVDEGEMPEGQRYGDVETGLSTDSGETKREREHAGS